MGIGPGYRHRIRDEMPRGISPSTGRPTAASVRTETRRGISPGSTPTPAAQVDGNPQPYRWTLVREERVGSHCILEVKYTDCRNYEGRKIMVYRASGLSEIVQKNKGSLDPHFLDDRNYLSPIARFEPNMSGWNNALRFARTL